jgi:hypothetical protein
MVPLLFLLGFRVLAAVASASAKSVAGRFCYGQKDQEDEIRKAIEAMEEEELRFVLSGDVAGATRDWADDLSVNAPNHQVMRKPAILEPMRQHTGLQYSSAEPHREAMIIGRDCIVTMGYEIVVPKGDVPNSGKTINRR